MELKDRDNDLMTGGDDERRRRYLYVEEHKAEAIMKVATSLSNFLDTAAKHIVVTYENE